MTICISINGFGRMGRLGLRAGWDMSEFQIVRINEISTDANGSSHLLKFDSVHGICDKESSAEIIFVNYERTYNVLLTDLPH